MNDTTNLIPEQCPGWKCGDGLYPVLRDAQKAALEAVIGENLDAGLRGDVAAVLIDRREDVIKILSLEAPKERKPRADKGRPRTKKIAPVAPEPSLAATAESTVTGSGKYRGK